ncbi:MAG: glycosyltransferase family 2 protein [Schwartzia sp.]|nr:glycosyltransferase family 2 protein [Schwartzia sp. (in: firmicutes)]
MISVIMPAYNVEKYIARSVESVLAQTYGDFELLVIEDGSTDGTGEIADALAEKDGRIVVIHQANGGAAAARNRGLDEARGEFVALLDADDLWDAEFLEKTHAKMVACGGNFVYANTEERFLDGSTNFIGSVQPREEMFDGFLHATGEYRQPFHTSAVLIRRSLIEKYHIRFPVGIRFSEDTAFFLQVLSVTKTACVPETLFYYCRRDDSANGRPWNPREWESTVVIFERIADFVEKNYPEGMAAFRIIRNYRTYRFVLDCAKRGYTEEAKEYAARWRSWLEEFARGNGRFMDRLKCRGILAAGGAWTGVIGKL